jgi:uncharacterized membrane protein YkvA (DUF1232 family)
MNSVENHIALQCPLCSTVNPPDAQLCKGCAKPVLDWESIAGEYGRYFNDFEFELKIERDAAEAGKETVELAILLYLTLKQCEGACEPWVKRVLVGALGLFVAGKDLIPDNIPGTGYLDDKSIMGMAKEVVSGKISHEIQEAASMGTDKIMKTL